MNSEKQDIDNKPEQTVLLLLMMPLTLVRVETDEYLECHGHFDGGLALQFQ